MGFKRLDELRVDDPIIRSYLRREVLKKSKDFTDEDTIIREVYVDEEFRADLLSNRVYGTESLRWLPVLIAKNDGESDPLPIGKELRLPSPEWIREQIRHFESAGSLTTKLRVTRRGRKV